MSPRIAVVTGASGGIGKGVAALLAGEGYIVYDVSRSGTDESGIRHITCDVCDTAEVDAAVRRIADEAGSIDLLINNAGMGVSGAAEFTAFADAKYLFDVNFFGAAAVVRSAVPFMRAGGGGRIINISSVAADIPIPFQSYYSASKAALSSFSLSMCSELKPFGIDVTAILPGDTATGFTASRRKDHDGDDVYNGRISRSVGVMERDEQNGASAAYVSKKIVHIAHKKTIRPIYAVGLKYKMFLLLVKLLPRAISNRIVYMLYAR